MEIASALLEFSEADALNPRLRISLAQRIRGYDANVLITGSMDAPQVVLMSSPPLPQDAIVLLVMTGMTPAEIDRKGAERVAATQAAMYFGRQLVDEFSPGDPTAESFFDDLTIETESAKREGYYDPLSVEYRVARDLTPAGDEVFLQGERDTYGDYNFHVGIRFQLD
jgi:translocation and assembly module TamB